MIEKRLRFESSIVHPLLSVTTPSIFVVTLHSILRGSLSFPPRFPDLLSWLAPAASLLEAVAGNAARRERADSAWRLREIALYLLAVAALFITLGIPFAHFGYLAALILTCWTLSFALHAALRSREELVRWTEGKVGPELSRAMHQSLLLEGDAMVKLRGVRAAGTILSGSLLLFAAVLVLAGRPLRPASALLLSIQAVVLQIVAAELASLAGEQRLLAHSLRLRGADREVRLAYGLIEIGAALALALVLARRAPLLSIRDVGSALERLGAALAAKGPRIGPALWRLLARFLAWIGRLFPAPLSTGPGGPLGSPSIPRGDPSPVMQRLFFALGMTLAALGIGLAIAFLVVPLTDAEFAQGVSRKRPLRFLRHRLALLARLARRAAGSVLEAIRVLAMDLRSPRSRAVSGAALRSGSMRTRGAGAATAAPRRTASELREIRRMRGGRQRALRAFAVLAAWSARHGYPHRACLGPLEFAREAGRRFPGAAVPLECSAVLVEQILYGPLAVDPHDLRELARRVREIRRVR